MLPTALLEKALGIVFGQACLLIRDYTLVCGLLLVWKVLFTA